MSKPKVSVVMITYGHEEYIEESINGILTQNFDDEIELIISDDCSPDNTQSIIEKIIVDHPNGHWIKYIRQSKNKGAISNFADTIAQATGTYIAICEGDDYWIDPLKIKKQVNFLENNPDYSMVFHKVREVNQNGISSHITLESPDTEKTYNIKDLAEGNFIHTPSIVFTKNFSEFPTWIHISPLGDYPLHMLNAQYGLIKYLPEEMAAYRVGSGIWSKQSRIYRIVNTMFTVKLLISYFSDKKEISQLLANQYNHLMNDLFNYHNQLAPVSPETAAYNLPFKKLLIIIIRKIKHLIK